MSRMNTDESRHNAISTPAPWADLAAGQLGVIMARAGVGKTTFLVQIGLNRALRRRRILHVAVGQTLEQVNARYETLLNEVSCCASVPEKEEFRAAIYENRLIRAIVGEPDHPDWFERSVQAYRDTFGVDPSSVLVDGFDWRAEKKQTRRRLESVKKTGFEINAEVWLTAQTHRTHTAAHPTSVPPPCDAAADLLDLALFLEPSGAEVAVRLLHGHPREEMPTVLLHSAADTRCLFSEQEAADEEKRDPHDYTLLSGGNTGAESTFGDFAEHFRVAEKTISYRGRHPERTRGIVELSETQLQRGRVSATYVREHIQRWFPHTPDVDNILATIWHQVTEAEEVFVVGMIRSNYSVEGGTGWAVELARNFGKPVYVFDQNRSALFTWSEGKWTPVGSPIIHKRRFVGTGTRFLTERGRTAIQDLFAATFRAPGGSGNRSDSP